MMVKQVLNNILCSIKTLCPPCVQKPGGKTDVVHLCGAVIEWTTEKSSRKNVFQVTNTHKHATLYTEPGFILKAVVMQMFFTPKLFSPFFCTRLNPLFLTVHNRSQQTQEPSISFRLRVTPLLENGTMPSERPSTLQ